jgi:hypothetical protein
MLNKLLAVSATAALLALGACADVDVIPERGLDQDISATHDGTAPTVRNLGPRGGENWRLGGPFPVGQ